MTLTEFLLARIAEDEALARAATPGPWEVWDNMHGDPHIVEAGKGPLTGGIALANTRDDYGRSNAAHIATQDPARVLAECEAKRSLLELSDNVEFMHQDFGTALRLGLALPYAGHPDYRGGWKP